MRKPILVIIMNFLPTTSAPSSLESPKITNKLPDFWKTANSAKNGNSFIYKIQN